MYCIDPLFKDNLTPGCLTSNLITHTNLAVAIASQLRDEAHMILADLNHLLADVVLGAAGYRRASPPIG